MSTRLLASISALLFVSTSVAHAQRPLARWDEFATGTQFGAAVASAGDLDGDGRDDLLVGRPGSDQVSVFYGNGSQTVVSGASGSGFGRALASIGDVTGDGRPDYAVGAPALGSGEVRIHSGSTHALVRTLSGSASADAFGSSISALGDRDGDHVPDLVVGAPQDAAHPGYARVCSGTTGASLATYVGLAAGQRFGAAVAGVEDLDLDGHPEVVVGAPGYDGAGANDGRVTVFSSANGASLANFTGDPGDELGTSLANVGDLDLDGLDDVLAGGPRSASDGLGVARALSVAAGAMLFELTGDGWFGASVGAAGDFDDDGYLDVVVGAPNVYDGRGQATVFSGHDQNELAVAGGFFNPNGFPGAGTGVGAAVAKIGDFDGDGRDDVAVGGPDESNCEYFLNGHTVALSPSRSARVVRIPFTGNFGFAASVRYIGDLDGDGAEDLALSWPVRVISGADGSTMFSLSGEGPVARAGDVNNDGTNDVLVGGMTTRVRSGADGSILRTLPGSEAFDGDADVDGDGSADLVLMEYQVAHVYSGASGAVLHTIPLDIGAISNARDKNVAFLGDLDLDLRPEFAIGEPGYFDQNTGTIGRVRVFSGASGALVVELSNASGMLHFGSSVCDAGDFDGDGVRDLAIAATEETPSYQFLGYVQVYSGADFSLLFDSGVNEVIGWSQRPGEPFGFEVRGVGDVDLDGFDDLAISSPSEYGGVGFNQWCTGRAMVLGGPDGHWLFGAEGYAAYDSFGYTLDGGGDVDGDGIPDLAFGIPAGIDNTDGCVTSGSRVELVRSPAALAQMDSYCPAAANSQWEDGARLFGSGSSSVARNDLVLHARHGPVGKLGLFFMGPTQVQVPYGAGMRCVGGAVRRFAPLQAFAGPLGETARAIDLSSGPASAITAGSTWNFQLIFRDGGTSNTSNALSVVFRQ